jgi:hypothetical protein
MMKKLSKMNKQVSEEIAAMEVMPGLEQYSKKLWS